MSAAKTYVLRWQSGNRYEGDGIELHAPLVRSPGTGTVRVTIEPIKSKRERREQAIRDYLPNGATYDRELVQLFLEALDRIDSEDP